MPLRTFTQDVPTSCGRRGVVIMEEPVRALCRLRFRNRKASDIKRIIFKAKPSRNDRKSSKKYQRFFAGRKNPV